MERDLDTFHHFTSPSFIVPNGIDLKEVQESISRREARKRLALDFDGPVITFLGRLSPVKALDLLIQAISSMSFQDQDLRLLIVGPDAGAAASLKKLVKEIGLEARVRFLKEIGPQERAVLFAASDLLTLVSTHENFGYAAVEAMLAGLPVLVSENVGISREILADGAGLVVPLEVEAIARALRQLLANRNKLKVMGAAAAVAARRRYDIRNVAQEMAIAYEDILARRRSPGLFWSDG